MSTKPTLNSPDQHNRNNLSDKSKQGRGQEQPLKADQQSHKGVPNSKRSPSVDQDIDLDHP